MNGEQLNSGSGQRFLKNTNKEVVMGSRLVTWTLGVGLLGVVLLALSLVSLTTTRSTVAYAAEQADLLDINTAIADQLKALPGIGDAYTEKIITDRPYQRKDELAQKKILPRVTYEGINYKIVAQQFKSNGGRLT